MNNSSIKYVIWTLALSSLLLASFGHYSTAPGALKAMFGASLWLCVFLFPYKYIKHNDFGRIANITLRFIFILTIVAVIRSVLDDSCVVIGNKWITLFGNPDCSFMLLTPCFAYLGMSENSLPELKKILFAYLFIGSLLLLVERYVTHNILWISIVFYPYVDKKYKILIVLSVLVAIYRSFYDNETSRTTIIVLAFSLTSYILAYVYKGKTLLFIFCATMIILPTIYACFTLTNDDYSIFNVVLSLVLEKTGDAALATDTRTFLFWEMATDLTNNDAWILGKGAYSHYFSHYFSKAEGDHFNRISCEVTLLQFLLRSGIVYVITYYSLLIYAIHKSLSKSNNRFLLSVAVMASGWFFVSCMSYLNGCDFKHLGFFLLLGCCLSSFWLEKSDDEIKEIFES